MEQTSQRQPSQSPDKPARKRKSVFSVLADPIRNARAEAAEIRAEEKVAAGTDATKKLIERKWMASLAVSEIAGTFIGAPLVGALAQYITGDAKNGIIGTVAGDYFPAVGAYAVMWYSLNRNFYKSFKGFFRRIKELAKDMLPFISTGLVAAIPAYGISAGLSSLYLKGAKLISKAFANRFPIPIIAETLNYFVAEAVFLYGAIKLRHWPLRRFQERYEREMEPKSPENAKPETVNSKCGLPS